MSIPSSVITAVLTELMESMYFMSPEYCGQTSVPGLATRVGVRFSGMREGCFRISVSNALATRMAADFLACDIALVDGEQVVATVSELANVACGATMSAWMPQSDFHFSVPFALEPGSMQDLGFSILSGEPEIWVGVSLISAESSDEGRHT